MIPNIHNSNFDPWGVKRGLIKNFDNTRNKFLINKMLNQCKNDVDQVRYW